MLAHVILGMMRDGRVWHGYALKKEYRRLSGLEPNEGNFYGKLAQLVEKDFIQSSSTPEALAAADPGGRIVIPYCITDRGKHEFDTWLLSPATLHEEMASWLLFLNLVPPDTLESLLGREKQRRLQRCKSLAHQVEDEVEDAHLNGHGYDARALLLQRELKHATTDLEWLEELQHAVTTLRGQGLLSR
jgi:DNA-binding PadR family transcriptional regulator